MQKKENIFSKNTIWINNKNGKEYTVLGEAIDCTNERDGLEVIVYEIEGKQFVREKKEFTEKFHLKTL